MSENYEKVKYYYDHKMWNKKRVRVAVGRWITARTIRRNRDDEPYEYSRYDEKSGLQRTL